MKFSWGHLLAVALLGGLFGYWISSARNAESDLQRQSKPSVPGATDGKRTKSDLRQDFSPVGRTGRLKQEIRSAPQDQLPLLAYRALCLSDPEERRAMLKEAMMMADAETRVAIFYQFAKVTAETGRLQPEDWTAAQFMMGQKQGPEVLEILKSKGVAAGDPVMWNCVYGMAFDDPAIAESWLKDPTNNLPGKDALREAILAGATLKDPDEGQRMLETLPEDQRARYVGHVAWNMIQSSGLDRAVAWMVEARGASGPDSAYSQAIENEVYSRMLRSVQPGDASQLARQLETINRQQSLPPERILGTFGALSGMEALDLADHLEGTAVLKDPQVHDTVITHSLSSMSNDQLRNWLVKNPKSSLAPAIREKLGE